MGNLTPVFLPGESHGQRSLAGYSPWHHKDSDTTEKLILSHFHTWQGNGYRICRLRPVKTNFCFTVWTWACCLREPAWFPRVCLACVSGMVTKHRTHIQVRSGDSNTASPSLPSFALISAKGKISCLLFPLSLVLLPPNQDSSDESSIREALQQFISGSGGRRRKWASVHPLS